MSEGSRKIECMFDTVFAGAADDALVGAIEQAAREEAQASARRLAAIAELVHRTVEEDDARGRWAFDPWNNTAARVGAALSVGQRRASGQMRIAVALRDRLPGVAALFFRGVISARVVSEISWRTHLVDSDELIALIDKAIAERAVRWGPLSEVQLGRAIDSEIEWHDPDAVRRSKEVIRTRDFHIGGNEDPNEVTAVWGRLSAPDAAVLQRRISTMVAGVCDGDPRSVGERWADALGALGNGNHHLSCRCSAPQCPAAEAATSNVVIRVIADQAAVDAARELIAAENAERQAPDARPAPDRGISKNCGAALLPGRGVVPTAVLAEAIRGGAKVARLWLPGAEPETGYRPSARLAEFIRVRDMFCRFPNCDVPADRCDIDHVIPWPLGPTHPSNLNCKCRTHHLMKTFWGGPEGWSDSQLPDATVIWTAPDGRTYATRPGSRLFFPWWNTGTADLPPPTSDPPTVRDRSAMMPRRRRTRAVETAAHIKAERALNNLRPQNSPR
ncbi:hypothetical protein NGTWS0302_31400 [Mycolicibacterium cyprinidarum]|uniref:HNH nuclease domain-containing protein n=1 Tax=Mycolicibacterium cyprinidarum TaxID=2860311 RepID=A0ABQ4V5M5_9MYCO|nr:hypothetical protein NGTWS1702_29670 [Mycolicibacterium sp. NGTWSNA01]GJF12474.1 hypothetical protein NGTWS0302_31400 [Mycolicibacterium sp. NGTWS0302]